MPALHDWQNFYLLTGTAAATLIGLLFVGVSISVGVNLMMKRVGEAIETFVTPILISYAQVFLISCLGVIPFQAPLIPGAILLALGSINTIRAIWIAWRILALHHDEMGRNHWIWHFLMPFLAGLLLVGTALVMLKGDMLALAGLAITTLLCLAIGLRNSWVLTLWLILQRTPENDAVAAKPVQTLDTASFPE